MKNRLHISTKRYYALFLIIPVTAFLLYFLFSKPTTTEAAWFDPNFSFRKLMQISNSSTLQTDFQVQFTIDTEDLITNSKLQSDCDDIRFTNISGKQLNYWIEPTTCNTTETLVWVKVDSIHTTGTDIYFYYGNPTATSVSSTQNTFIKDMESAVANWPLDDTTTTQSYARVVNQGVEEGRNIVANSTFDSSTGWAMGAGWSISGGVAVGTATGTGATFNYNSATLTQGKAYKTTFTISGYTSGSITMQVGNGTAGTYRSADGTYTQTLIAGSSTTQIQMNVGTSFTGNIDNVSVTELNIPSTSATYTQLLSDGDMETSGTSAWTAGNSALLSKQTTNPFEGSQIIRVTRNGSNNPLARQSSIVTAGQVYRITGYMRSDGSATPVIVDNTTLVTGSTSTSWQAFDTIFVAANTEINLQCNSSGTQYCEFDDVTVSPDNYIRSGELLQDEDMETSGTGSWYAALSGTTLSKQTTNPQEGIQTLRVTTTTAFGRAEQYTLVSGKKYRVQGYMRGDGTIGTPQISNSSIAITGGTGTSSNSWQFFDLTFIAANSLFSLNNNQASGYAEFDDISVTEVPPLVGLPTNGVTLGSTANGHLTNAYTFDGTNDNVNIYSSSLNSSFNPDEGTLVAWAKVSGSGVWTDGTPTRYIANIQSVFATNQINIQKNGNNNLRFTYAAGGTFKEINQGSLSSTNWYQVVLTWSKTADELKAYINGNQVDSTQTGLGTWTGNLTSTDVTIGSYNTTGTTNPWSGLINDVRLYDRALTADEIKAMHNPHYDVQAYTTNNYPNRELLRKYNTGITTGSFASEQNGPGPVAYWKFDDGQGQTAQDSTVNNNDGTLGASSASGGDDPTWTTEDQCVSGKCLKFDGSADFISIADSSTIDTSTVMTLSTWVKPTVTNLNQMILSKYDSSTSDYEYGFFLRSNGILEYYFKSDSANNGVVTTTTALTANKWYHLTGTADGTNLKLYIDGILVNTTTQNGDGTGFTDDPITIGQRGDSTQYFNGFIDEPQIYPYARSAAQVKTDYAQGAASLGLKNQSNLSNGLIGYWKMDESSANSCTGGVNDTCDSSGNANDGTWTGSTTAAAGKFGNGASFSGGASDYISIPDNDLFEGTSQLTASIWVYDDAFTGVQHDFFNKGGEPYAADSTWAFYRSSLGVTAKVSNGTTYVVMTAISGTFINDAWNLVTLTYDGTTTRFYINGILQDTDSLTGNTDTNTHAVRIGGHTETNDGFNGKLDEARVYNRALSPAEIQQLYSYAPGPIGYWKFDEGSDSTAYDSSGNGNSGTLTNGTIWSAGKYGSAVEFDGVNDYVAMSTINTTLTQYTQSAWVYLDSYPASRYDWFYWGLDAHGNRVGIDNYGTNFRVVLPSNTYPDQRFSSAPAITNGWHYVTVTYENTNSKSYINGVLVNSSSNGVDQNITIPTWKLGGDGQGAGQYLDGKIDDVKIYNYARTQSQILEDMGSNPPPSLSGETLPDPIAHYRFDEQQGQTINNSGSIGSTVNGTLGANTGSSTDDPTWKTKTDCKINGCLSFDGTSDIITVSHTSSLNHSGDFAIGAWIYPTSTANLGIMNKIEAATNVGYRMLQRANGTIWCDVGTEAASTGSKDTVTYSLNEWQFFVCSRQGTAMNVYKNGKLIHSTTVSSSAITTTNNMLVGSQNGGANFAGKLDEVKIYNTALTAAQVKLDYNAGTSTDFGAAANAEATLLSDGAGNPPIAHWMFDEKQDNTCTGGTNDVCDKSGNGNDGFEVNSPQTIKGKLDQALKFNGTNQYVEVPDGTWNTAAPLTISAWFYPLLNTASGQMIVKNMTGAISGTFSIQAGSAGGNQRFSIYDGTTTERYCSYSSLIQANNWYHFTATITDSELKCYLNGKHIETVAISGFPYRASKLHFGARGLVPDMYYSGQIDDVKIYNYARTPAQIAYDYNRGKPIAHYRLDECQGATANDSSDNANHGTITIGGSGTQTAVGTCNTSSTAWGNGATGKFNSSLNFDGTDDYASCTDAQCGGTTKLDLGNNSQTISSWVKTTQATRQYIVAKGIGAAHYSFDLEIANSQIGDCTGSQGKAIYIFYNTLTNPYIHTCGTTEVSDGNWHHIVGTYDATNTTMRLYVDGKLQHMSNTTSGSLLSDSASDFTIGKRGDNTGYFSGQIDDVQIYNYALSAAQVQQLYNGSSVRFGPLTGSP